MARISRNSYIWSIAGSGVCSSLALMGTRKTHKHKSKEGQEAFGRAV